MSTKPRVGRVLLAAFAALLDQLPLLAKMLAVPSLLLFVIGYLETRIEDPGFRFLMQLPHLVVYTLIGVNVTRLTLAGPGAISPLGLPRWRMQETRYLAAMIGILFIGFSIVLVGGSLGPVGLMAGLLATALIAGRLSLVFPALAMGRADNFGNAWINSRGHTRLMVAIAFLVPLLASGPAYLVAFSGGPEWLSVLLEIPGSVYAIIALALAYSEIDRFRRASLH